MQDPVEVEIKIALKCRETTTKQLLELGFRESVGRLWETNELYDTRDALLRGQEMLLRLRQAGNRSVLTWKGPSQPGVHKSRPELETSIGSAEVFAKILEHLGYTKSFRYEKYRTEYQQTDKPGVVTVDETPIGDFLEIEGSAVWIDQTAASLGFARQDYVLKSYGSLYLDHCQREGLEPSNMVFSSKNQEEPRLRQ
jgi:adenylate cyclase, class 2